MSEMDNSEGPSAESEKPVHDNDNDTIKFPPLPEPTDKDFDEDVSEEERNFYKNKFPDLNEIRKEKLHCTACDRHLGCSARNESRMRSHPMLRTLVCHTCHTFYNSGEFEKGDDGSELYCRWCGQGGQVYCCSDCPHVFCAKCVRRNFGNAKIKEIENTDDWKCFKCNSKCLWDIRAVCWALLRYCDLRNKITYSTQDSKLKEIYQKACATDDSECCKHKANRKKEKEVKKRDSDVTKKTAAVINKIAPTIQVKKFASMAPDDSPKEKKAQKRPASPKQKVLVRPVTTPILNRMINPLSVPQINKKIKLHNAYPIQTMRFQTKNNIQMTYQRIRPKPPPMPSFVNFNGYNNTGMMNNMVTNDNINLSLESLTQGLDMSALTGISHNQNDVVCTPDFPLEPLCEVNEDVPDDDVQCITPTPSLHNPAATNQIYKNPPPLLPRTHNHDLSNDNIIQMTENDVTVNEQTGGLKFRVDPQTLSSNKMYRLPDGRIFAINANPNMPGGYSATIVALADNNSTKPVPKPSTYAAKLNAVSANQTPSPTLQKKQTSTPHIISSKRNKTRQKTATPPETYSRECDTNVPVEWFRYNLIDAVDSLEYSLSRLQKLKKEATTMFLRTRTIEEMKSLHKTLTRLLSTSSTRFQEIRENLNKELKSYITKKTTGSSTVSDDDDDVEILNDEPDDPIFIDENSMDSINANETTNVTNTNEVDLTGPASSEHNDSGDKSIDGFDKEPNINNKQGENNEAVADVTKNDDDKQEDKSNELQGIEETSCHVKPLTKTENTDHLNGNEEKLNDGEEESRLRNELIKDAVNESIKEESEVDDEEEKKKAEDDSIRKVTKDNEEEKKKAPEDDSIRKDTKVVNIQQGDDKSNDVDMSEELIETLLRDDTGVEGSESQNCMDISDELQEP